MSSEVDARKMEVEKEQARETDNKIQALVDRFAATEFDLQNRLADEVF